ncbi:Fic family protein [soil metagenome]
MDNSLSKWPVDDAVGAAWLAHRYGVDPVQPLRALSRIGGSRTTHREGNRWQYVYEERYRPKGTFKEHLEFMFRREPLNLEFLSRLFREIPPNELAEWVHREPTGRYSRRAGYLYECLTGRELDFEGVTNGPYVEVLDSERFLAASKARTITRWHVKDNLPGSRAFCPVVCLTDAVRDALAFDVAGGWSDLENEFGSELLRRSAVWMTVKESRSSFAIEGEGRETDRIQRFAVAMERELGQHTDVFAVATLEYLQRSILGESATAYGVRRSPIFVGETHGNVEIVHFVAPRWDMIRDMLDGLSECDRLTVGRHPLLRAAVLSFGFIYVHPLTDGNGRISRFLVNDVLRRDGVLPEPFVLPISTVISGSMKEYDRTLELLSKPLMRRYAGEYRLGQPVRYDDGFVSTLHFDAYEKAEPVWRYPDLTDHVAYLAGVVRTTMEDELKEEAGQMRAYRGARDAVNELIEGPDEDLYRIVRSVHGNAWRVSGKLKSEFPILEDEGLAERVGEAVKEAFVDG